MNVDEALWMAGIVSFVLWDTLSTSIGLTIPGVIEGHPLMIGIASAGFWSILGWKVVAVFVLYALYRIAPAPHRIGVPLGLVTIGVTVSVWNTCIILRAIA